MMLHLRQHCATIEITLALLGSFGMILMALNPLMGKTLMGGVLALLFLIYLLIGALPRDPEANNSFQVILGRINFLVASCADGLLLLLLVFLPGKLALAIPAIGLLVICLVLNTAHRYLYGIHEPGYIASQLRLLILAGLVLVMMVIDGHFEF
jgi:hypothetical protein